MRKSQLPVRPALDVGFPKALPLICVISALHTKDVVVVCVWVGGWGGGGGWQVLNLQ